MKDNMSFVKHPTISGCHELNGVNMGSLLYSLITCHEIITHTAAEMRKELVNHIIRSGSKFSILVDESTTVSSKSDLTVYIRLLFDDEITNYFLEIIDWPDKTGHGIAEIIFNTLLSLGLTNITLKNNLIGFASDGASSMRGLYSGAVKHLEEMIGNKLISFHCMTHRLELEWLILL